MFYNKLDDCFDLCLKYEKFKFTNFYDEFGLSDAILYCEKNFYNKYITFGGKNNCQRQIIGFSPEFIEHKNTINYNSIFPIKCVCFEFCKNFNNKEISHRDVLGSIMAQNIKRKMIGDIIIFDEKAYIFCCESVSNVLLDIDSIGKRTVKAFVCDDISLLENSQKNFLEYKITISSLRIDNIISKFINVSREQANQLIKQKSILINGIICEKSSKNVIENDIITIKQYGKYIVEDVLGYSKKGKIILQYKKFN
ncbi:MAG: YlmH/Sll1252 family protein [Oscillospiraceae bacterium]